MGEQISWHGPIGGLVALVGVALAQGQLRGAATAAGSRGPPISLRTDAKQVTIGYSCSTALARRPCQ
jgi:hypothetical protein